VAGVKHFRVSHRGRTGKGLKIARFLVVVAVRPGGVLAARLSVATNPACIVPELHGAYLFADYVNGQVSVLRFDEQSGKEISVEPIQPPTMPVFSFGEDAAGEVYFMTTQGVINRFVLKRK
jgi:hypothetical protein